MKWLAPLLVLLAFSDPQGAVVWIEKSAVIAILRGVDCQKPSETKLVTSGGSLCVKESIDDVVAKFGNTK